MATVTLTIPDDKVADCVAAIADQMGVEIPTTDAGKIALAQAWFTQEMKNRRVYWKGKDAQAKAQSAAMADWQ